MILQSIIEVPRSARAQTGKKVKTEDTKWKKGETLSEFREFFEFSFHLSSRSGPICMDLFRHVHSLTCNVYTASNHYYQTKQRIFTI